MKIGIIGAGAIATYVMKELASQPDMNVCSLLVRDKQKYADLASHHEVDVYTSIEAFLDSEIDIVVEAANVEAVNTYLPDVIRQKDIVVISIGAFVDEDFYHNMQQIAQELNHHIYLPSGAIGGLDVIQNASATNTLKKVALETRKPAHTLMDESINQEKVIYAGTAADAIKQFPKNINVAIALGLAGIGLEQTSVTIIADPSVDRNIHSITASGSFGQATFQIENESLPSNASTSYLAAMSVVGTLKRRRHSLHIGH